MKKYNELIRHQGNNGLFDMIDISILGSLTGTPIHIHAEGLRGTGKTTIMRAAKNILPKIERIKGCVYNCDPRSPHCPEHRNLSEEEIRRIGTEFIDMPFLEISPSARKGTVVGSIDLKKIMSKERPDAALLLGTIPRAHRGIIFVDEINRIADISPELADILLDVMGTKPGRIQIEEAGLPPVEIPVQVSVWAASNPDEEPGPLEDIRRQLSDRFDFTVNVERPLDINVIKKILEQTYQENYDNFLIESKKNQLQRAQEKIPSIIVSDDIKTILSSIYVDFTLESLRGIEAIMLGAKIRGALLGKVPDIEDVITLSRYAFRHRIDSKSLNDIIKNLEQKKNRCEKKAESLSIPFEHESKKIDLKSNDGKSKVNSRKVPDNLYNPMVRLMAYIINKFGPPKKNSTNTVRSVDPKDIEIKAPARKALPIKELELKEYVKNEEELRNDSHR